MCMLTLCLTLTKRREGKNTHARLVCCKGFTKQQVTTIREHHLQQYSFMPTYLALTRFCVLPCLQMIMPTFFEFSMIAQDAAANSIMPSFMSTAGTTLGMMSGPVVPSFGISLSSPSECLFKISYTYKQKLV